MSRGTFFSLMLVDLLLVFVSYWKKLNDYKETVSLLTCVLSQMLCSKSLLHSSLGLLFILLKCSLYWSEEDGPWEVRSYMLCNLLICTDINVCITLDRRGKNLIELERKNGVLSFQKYSCPVCPYTIMTTAQRVQSQERLINGQKKHSSLGLLYPYSYVCDKYDYLHFLNGLLSFITVRNTQTASQHLL